MYKIIETKDGASNPICSVSNIDAVKGICEMLNNDSTDAKYSWEPERPKIHFQTVHEVCVG